LKIEGEGMIFKKPGVMLARMFVSFRKKASAFFKIGI